MNWCRTLAAAGLAIASNQAISATYTCKSADGAISITDKACVGGFRKEGGEWIDVQREQRERIERDEEAKRAAEEVQRVLKADRIANQERLRSIKAANRKHRHPLDGATDASKIASMNQGMQIVKGMLKDPGSAQFSNVYYNVAIDGTPVSCGMVNAKNSFGGYVGSKRFYSYSGLSAIDDHKYEFNDAWDRYCD